MTRPARTARDGSRRAGEVVRDVGSDHLRRGVDGRRCWARGPVRWVCTRRPVHDGQHEAVGLDGTVLEVWS